MKSIGTKLACQIAFVLIVAMALFGIFQTYQQKQSYKTFLRNKEEHTLKPLALILGTLIFNVEQEQIETVIRSYLDAPDIVAITMTGRGVTAVFLKKDPATLTIIELQEDETTSFQDIDSIMYEEPLLYLNREVGTLEVVFSRQFLTDQTQRLMLLTSGNIGLAIVIGSLAMLLLVRKHITKPLLNLVRDAQQIADGNFDIGLVNISSQNEIRQVMLSIRQMTEKIGDVLDEINCLTQAIQKGKLDVRGNTQIFSGSWRNLVAGVNNVIDAFVFPINMTADYIDHISKGDIPEKITAENKGDLKEKKYNINRLIHNLRTTVA